MIKRIRIKDFKSIRDVTVDLSPVTVLVGRSGTGKSNFVAALRFLRNYLLDQRHSVSFEGGWPVIMPAGGSRPETRLEVQFRVPASQDDFCYTIAWGFLGSDDQLPQYGGMLPVREEQLQVGSRVLFHRTHDRKGWDWHAKPAVHPPMNPGGDRLVVSQLPTVPEAVWAYTFLATGIGVYAFSTTDGPGKSVIPQELAKHFVGLHDDGSNYLEVMKSLTQNVRDAHTRSSMRLAMQKVGQNIQSFELDSLTNPQDIIVGHRFGDVTLGLPLARESAGQRRFFSHLLALYQLPPKLVSIFEEPENGIFPGALELLASEFVAAPEAGRGQVILTTHSPNLLDHLDVQSLRVTELRDGGTVIGLVDGDQQAAVRDQLLRTGELLTVDPVRIGDTPPTGAVQP